MPMSQQALTKSLMGSGGEQRCATGSKVILIFSSLFMGPAVFLLAAVYRLWLVLPWRKFGKSHNMQQGRDRNRSFVLLDWCVFDMPVFNDLSVLTVSLKVIKPFVVIIQVIR
jgi:hypothetical protein